MKLILHEVSHPQIHLFDSDHWYGCGQAHQGLPEVILKMKTSICQDWIKLWWWFLSQGFPLKSGQ